MLLERDNYARTFRRQSPSFVNADLSSIISSTKTLETNAGQLLRFVARVPDHGNVADGRPENDEVASEVIPPCDPISMRSTLAAASS